MKENNEKIAALTAYDYTFAKLMDKAGIDLLLIGDSAANVIAGRETTIPMTMDEMIYHSRAVVRGASNAFIVADMPFMSYQESREKALHNAGRLMKEGHVEGVKIEGGQEIAATVESITEIGIPVLGHLGLTPQSIHALGGYGVQATEKETAQQLRDDALALEDAGAFGIVFEEIPSGLAEEVTNSLSIPTIGIGAGNQCDGQILVAYDMLGMNEEFSPKFLREYSNLSGYIKEAVSQYCEDVKKGNYPSEKESFF